MKIGIVTFEWANNYGALIQSHALQSVLMERGHQVEIIKYRPKIPASLLKRILAKNPKKLIKKWLSLYHNYLFNKFRRQFLNRTSKTFRSIQSFELIKDRYDILISGSDQVWNPKWLDQITDMHKIYLLSFLGNNTKIISYAASFGTGEIDSFSPEWYKIFNTELSKFDAISVREKSGIQLVEKLTKRKDAVSIVDPTLLLNKHKYSKIISNRRIRKKYVFSYMLHGYDNDASSINSYIANKQNLNIINCNAKDSFLRKNYKFPSPPKWLKLIKNARFVVTNSFHGVVFCLIFHKPFVVLSIQGEMGKMNSRIIDLLSAVGLKERIVNHDGLLMDKLVEKSINWEEIDTKVNSLRNEAFNFLESQMI